MARHSTKKVESSDFWVCGEIRSGGNGEGNAADFWRFMWALSVQALIGELSLPHGSAVRNC